MAKDSDSQFYAPLLDEEDDTRRRSASYASPPTGARRLMKTRLFRSFSPTLLVSLALNLILAFSVVYLLRHTSDSIKKSTVELTYSPANVAVEWKAIKFHRGFGYDTPIYEQPPSAEVDKAWKDLYYDYLASFMYREEAQQMANVTIPIGNRTGYMVGIDLFHQLHCLDLVRKRLHPDEYPIEKNPDINVTMGHIRHCIGVIRQPLMCFSDVSAGVWQWSPRLGRVAARDDILHTCRDFEKIQDWAKERYLYNEDYAWDYSHHVEDDLTVKGWEGSSAFVNNGNNEDGRTDGHADVHGHGHQ